MTAQRTAWLKLKSKNRSAICDHRDYFCVPSERFQLELNSCMSPANPAFSISARRSFSSARPTKTAPTIWRRCLRPSGRLALPSGSRRIEDDAEHHADRRVRPQSAVRRQCRRSETSRAHDGVKSGSGGKGAPGLQIHAIAAGALRHCEFRTIALTVTPGSSLACPGHPRRSTTPPVRVRSRSAGHLPAARTPNRVDGRA